MVLDSGLGGGWRSRVLGLRELVKAETQLVYLTATLRPADEARRYDGREEDVEEMEGARLEKLLGREAGFSGWRAWGGASLRRNWNMEGWRG